MEMRAIGTSGMATPPLVLGGNVFGWTADEAASFAVLDGFVAGGGRMIDTADVYSAWVPGHVGGESEAAIGRWLKRSGKRDAVLIATKVGMLDGDGGSGLAPARIVAAAEESLRRLGTDRIDLYYAHRDDPAQPLDAVADAFDRLVRAGKVRAIAASNYSAERLAAILDVQEQGGLARFQALQPEYNLMARDGFEGPLQQLCLARGLAVLPYYALAAGYLTGKYRTAADLAQSVRGNRVRLYLEGKGPAVLAAMDALAEETGATPAQLALAWLAARPGVAAPIASATGVAQLDELMGAMRLTLSAGQVARLDAAAA